MWNNEYLRLENQEYERRHGKTLVRKWVHALKIFINNKYIGKKIEFDEAKQLIDSYDVISFDIFDTLLIRPYDKPTDLFYDIEKKEGILGFANARIIAEKEARNKYRMQEDITLGQIYDEIEDKYKLFMAKEMEYEETTIQVNSIVFRLFQYAKKKQKQIIIISDMYLSSNFLKRLLMNKGITGFAKLYVSSETLETKASGNMYKYVQKDMNISEKKILHVGDNLYSDGNALYKNNIGFLCIDKSKYIWIERR